MKNVLTVLIVMVLLALVGGLVLAQSGNDLFQQALVKERAGSYQEAIKLYQAIVQKNSSDHRLAAKALFQMGQAYEKLGNAEAQKTYERIAKEFGDQKDIAADASRRMAVLTSPQTAGKPSIRTVLAGDELVGAASISFDGRWMAMTDWSTADGDLVVRDMGANQLRRLQIGGCGQGSKNCTFADSRVFSPDARQVAYAWYDETEIKGGAQLRVIANEAGAKPRVLVRNPEYDVWPRGWSADGKSILVVMEKPDHTWQLGWVSVADGSIKTITSLGWRIQQKMSYSVSVSPDGRYIAYSALPTNPTKAPPAANAPKATEVHIFILSADGRSETEPVKTAGINEWPVWTPDSAHILFMSDLSGKSDLWSVAVRDGKAEGSPFPIRRDVGPITPIGMTRSGSYYYVHNEAGIEQVSIAELAPGGGSRTVESFVGINPSWSPDGKSLAFKRHSTQFKDFYDLVVRSVETGEERIFFRDGIRGDPPRWLHGSQGFLTLVGADLSTFSWNVVDLKSGGFTRAVQRGLFRSGVAALSPDDRVLYVGERDSNSKSDVWDRIVAIDLAIGQERQVFTFPGPAETRPSSAGFAIALSPNGRTLVVATTNPKDQEMRLALVDIDGRNYRELDGHYRSSVANGLNDKLAWTKDGRSILYVTPEEGSNNNLQIMRIGIDGGNPEFMGLRVSGLSTFDLSPDGSRIAFSTTANATSTSEVVAIDNLSALLKNSK